MTNCIKLDVCEEVYENMTKEEIIDILGEMEEDHAQMYEKYLEIEKELEWWMRKATELAEMVNKL